MSKLESYSITPEQIHANEEVYRASHVIIESFGVVISEENHEAVTRDMSEEALKILRDLKASQKTLLDRCKKLSNENEALKLMYQSVMQERKDQEQNQGYLLRLIEQNEKLIDRVTELEK